MTAQDRTGWTDDDRNNQDDNDAVYDTLDDNEAET